MGPNPWRVKFLFGDKYTGCCQELIYLSRAFSIFQPPLLLGWYSLGISIFEFSYGQFVNFQKSKTQNSEIENTQHNSIKAILGAVSGTAAKSICLKGLFILGIHHTSLNPNGFNTNGPQAQASQFRILPPSASIIFSEPVYLHTLDFFW